MARRQVTRHLGGSAARRLGGSALGVALLAACAGNRPGALASPRLCPNPTCALDSITPLLDSAVATGAAPGAMLGVSYRGARYLYGTGRLALDDPRRPDGHTIYDLASLTKLIATTTLTMMAVSEGRLELDTPVGRYLPAYAGPGKEAVTIRHLLTHSSGLPAHRPLWRETPDREAALRLVNRTPLDTPPGTRMVYSDLGVIVLGQVIEQIYHDRLDRLAGRRIFRPLGMRSTGFRPNPGALPRIAATEYDTAWRKRIVRGEVHDENAAWLGGVAGHAGLFGSAVDLLAFGEWLLSVAGRQDGKTAGGDGSSAGAAHLPSGRLAVLPPVAREFTRRQHVVSGSSRALGWDTPSPGSSAGTELDSTSFGHTGFTGTSLWIDPTRDLVIVLLTNRVHPTRSNPRIGPLRIAVANRVVSLLEDLRVRTTFRLPRLPGQ